MCASGLLKSHLYTGHYLFEKQWFFLYRSKIKIMWFSYDAFSEDICIILSVLSPFNRLLDLKRVAYGCFLLGQEKKKTKALVRLLVKCWEGAFQQNISRWAINFNLELRFACPWKHRLSPVRLRFQRNDEAVCENIELQKHPVSELVWMCLSALNSQCLSDGQQMSFCAGQTPHLWQSGWAAVIRSASDPWIFHRLCQPSDTGVWRVLTNEMKTGIWLFVSRRQAWLQLIIHQTFKSYVFFWKNLALNCEFYEAICYS